MNREEQRQALEGILERLGRVRLELDDAVAEVNSLRDEANGDRPFDEELCRRIEWLCDDADSAADTAADTVKMLLGDLHEDEEEEEDKP